MQVLMLPEWDVVRKNVPTHKELYLVFLHVQKIIFSCCILIAHTSYDVHKDVQTKYYSGLFTFVPGLLIVRL